MSNPPESLSAEDLLLFLTQAMQANGTEVTITPLGVTLDALSVSALQPHPPTWTSNESVVARLLAVASSSQWNSNVQSATEAPTGPQLEALLSAMIGLSSASSPNNRQQSGVATGFPNQMATAVLAHLQRQHVLLSLSQRRTQDPLASAARQLLEVDRALNAARAQSGSATSPPFFPQPLAVSSLPLPLPLPFLSTSSQEHQQSGVHSRTLSTLLEAQHVARQLGMPLVPDQYISGSSQQLQHAAVPSREETEGNVEGSTDSDPIIEPFPQKLYRLLLETEEAGNGHIVSFMPSGKSFCVHNPSRFMRDISVNYFNHSKLCSFSRQLQLYNFRRVVEGTNVDCFAHDLFRRGHPELLPGIRRLPRAAPKKLARK
jgi:HSF-type DNA-binding